MTRKPHDLGTKTIRAALGMAACLAGLMMAGDAEAARVGAMSASEVATMKFAARIAEKASTLDAPLAFTPNDPLFGQQWHLSPTGARPHANVLGAWARGLTGAGVTIGIVDDSLQWTHPDLLPAYDAASSWDFGQNDGDPSPVHDNDSHGTAVAGVAAARGGNGIGVTGAAPGASLAGLRIDFENQAGGMFSGATTHRSVGPGATIDIKNHSYGVGVPYIPRQQQIAALEASVGAGTIHVFAAGNERDAHGPGGGGIDGDANKKATASHPDAIAVGALGADGKHSYYSNWGANLFVTAPSSGAGLGVTTTDRVGALGYDGGDYTNGFGGTSSATPLVAGVLALAKEANPALDTRMAKHLLALTSDHTIDAADSSDTSDGGWTTNAAGYTFNQNYGFGLIEADALTLAATQYAGVTDLEEKSTGFVSVNEALPDAIVNNVTPGTLSETFRFEGDGKLEEVLIDLEIDHTYTGDLQATLVSPSGTSSRLMYRNIGDSGNDFDWTFSSNAFWGEELLGDWTLTVEDWFTADTGIWNGFTATARIGSLIAVPEPGAAALLFMAVVGLGRGRGGR